MSMSRVELLESSYKEVLDATKHQDDKAGRLLSAISFLTAAALGVGALNNQDNLLSAGITFPLGVVRPVALFSLLYLVLILISVMLLLAGFAPPHRPSDRRQKSQIFYSPIAGFSDAEWNQYWQQSDAALTAERARNYLVESRNLAERLVRKYDRLYESLAVFTLSLYFLVLTALFAFAAEYSGASIHPSGIPPTVYLAPDATLRTSFGAITGLYLYLVIRPAGAPGRQGSTRTSTFRRQTLKVASLVTSGILCSGVSYPVVKASGVVACILALAWSCRSVYAAEGAGELTALSAGTTSLIAISVWGYAAADERITSAALIWLAVLASSATYLQPRRNLARANRKLKRQPRK